jgi:hypothetical protein
MYLPTKLFFQKEEFREIPTQFEKNSNKPNLVSNVAPYLKS